MDDALKKGIMTAVENEAYASALGMRLLILEDGFARVELRLDAAKTDNIYNRTHGGVIYALIDEAFEAASQTCGEIAVALNMNVSYVKSPEKNTAVIAEAKRKSRTRKTEIYDITVTDKAGNLIALCSAVAYKTGKPVPFR